MDLLELPLLAYKNYYLNTRMHYYLFLQMVVSFFHEQNIELIIELRN